MIKPGSAVKWDAASVEEKELMSNRDVELSYKDEGEQNLQPNLMDEPMYLIARSIINRGVKQECAIKTNDVIKLGRYKFKV